MRHAALFCAILGLVAPDLPAQSRLARPVIDTVNHHIVRVRNSGPSRWLETSGWKFVLERTIAPTEGSPALLAEPTSLAIDPAGQIFETDWKVDGIQVFAPDGRYLRTMGRKGDGPGEFKVPIDLDIRGDTLAAFASNQSRMSLWRTSGALLSTWSVGSSSWWSPHLDGRGNVQLATSMHVASRQRQSFVRWRPDGRATDTILLPIEPEYPGWRTTTGGVYSIPFVAYVVGTLDSRNRYISGNSTHYSLVVARAGNDTARLIELPGARVAIPKQIADSLFDRMTARGPLKEIAKRGDIPTEQPFFKALVPDEHDNIWIVRPGPDGKLASFDVIDPDGRFLGTVAAPKAPVGVFTLRNGRMYSTSETADGVPVILVYRIDRGAH